MPIYKVKYTFEDKLIEAKDLNEAYKKSQIQNRNMTLADCYEEISEMSPAEIARAKEEERKGLEFIKRIAKGHIEEHIT